MSITTEFKLIPQFVKINNNAFTGTLLHLQWISMGQEIAPG